MHRAISLMILLVIVIGQWLYQHSFWVESEEATLEQASITIEAKSGLVMDKTGQIIYEKNSSNKIYPASTTKIMTALLALEYGQLEEEIRVGEEVYFLKEGASSSGIEEGEIIKLKDLIKALLIPSGNDAANTLAVHISRSMYGEDLQVEEAIERFVQLMNQRAQALGATNTHFVNPHGYYDPEHYSTAKDMGLIAKEAMKYSSFREIVGTDQIEVTTNINYNEEKTHVWVNSNLLIHKESAYYEPKATGLKTGYTSYAGYCIIASAFSQGKSVLVMVYDSSENGRWTDAKTLIKFGLGLD